MNREGTFVNPAVEGVGIIKPDDQQHSSILVPKEVMKEVGPIADGARVTFETGNRDEGSEKIATKVEVKK